VEYKKQEESTKPNPNNPAYCENCHKDAIIFDNSANEFVCSSCGYVLSNDSLNNETIQGYIMQSDFNDRFRTGMPESLAVHHKVVNFDRMGDTDARKSITQNKEWRFRDSVWNSNLSAVILYQNLKSLKYLVFDKLCLNQAVDSAAYIYKKQ
jgi:transcription initiation factor TFIIB